ncbi:transposase [Nitrosomonas sp.]|uniref:transposase n=1 Tax=Nitrosomonas sp. TaxID=42353 RepID=UPI00374D9BDA
MKLAENIRILFLPPYSPELNPQEHVWDELRESSFITVPSIVWMHLRFIWKAR